MKRSLWSAENNQMNENQILICFGKREYFFNIDHIGILSIKRTLKVIVQLKRKNNR